MKIEFKYIILQSADMDGQNKLVQKGEIPKTSRNDLFFKFVDSTVLYGV